MRKRKKRLVVWLTFHSSLKLMLSRLVGRIGCFHLCLRAACNEDMVGLDTYLYRVKQLR